MPTGLRDLRVWQEAVALAAELLRLRRRAYRREIALPLDALANSALTLATEIAEGAGRYAPAEQRRAYLGARTTLFRLETLLAVARQSELLDPATHARLGERVEGVGRLLGGYLVYLERQVGEEGKG